MTATTYRYSLILLGSAFALMFLVLCVPPLLHNPDLIAAAAGGFVNPFAAGYALDAIFCWAVLATWVTYEAQTKGIRHGWIAVVLGIAPGVATGFAFYLLLKLRQEAVQKTTQPAA